MPENELVEWCAGMPLVLRRPIDGPERATLDREAHRLRRLGVGAVALFPLLVVLFAFTATGTDSRSAAVQAVLAVWAILLVAVCLPLQVLVARDALRRSGGLFRDLRAGYVKRYAGRPPKSRLTDETLARLQKAGHTPPPGDEQEWWIEVLPVSGRVWRVKGAAVRRWVAARWSEVARTPQFATIAAQWLEPVAHYDEATLLGGQRDLSAPERDELHRYARRLRIRLLPFVLLFTGWFCLPLAVILRHGTLHSRTDWVHFAFLAAATLWTDAYWVRALWVASRLERDARAGRLIILRADRREESPVPDEGVPETVEILPTTRWMWTEDERPAPWRVVRP